MGDTTVAPIILWDMGKNLTLGAAVEITIPTGEYDATRLANTSNNFYTYKPLFSFTWLPSERTELSVKTTYSFNQENHDTDYRSGQIFHFDYSASYKVTDNLNLGINGYYLKQTTDDKQFGRTVQFNGQDVNDGVRGEVFAIGPALYFTFLKYASADNMTGQPIYAEARCLLHPDAAAALERSLRIAQLAGYIRTVSIAWTGTNVCV